MVSLEQIFNANYIQYDRLIVLTNNAFKGSNSNNINIYIDLYSMIKPLYRDNYIIEDYSALTSCIINIVAHYRAFFRTRYNVESKFYLIYSKNCPYINKQFVQDYNAKNEYMMSVNNQKEEMIVNALELVKILAPYLPEVYYVTTEFEAGVIMKELILRDNITPHLIITKDKYLYQLPSKHDNCIIYRPMKKDGIDYSYYINKENVLMTYLAERKIKDRNSYIKISGEIMPLLFTLNTLPERNIKSILNITTFLSSVLNTISCGGKIKDLESFVIYYNSSMFTKTRLNYSMVTNRFKAIDLDFQHSIYIETSEYQNLDKCIIDLFDPETVRYINDKYFVDKPLDLMRL